MKENKFALISVFLMVAISALLIRQEFRIKTISAPPSIPLELMPSAKNDSLSSAIERMVSLENKLDQLSTSSSIQPESIPSKKDDFALGAIDRLNLLEKKLDQLNESNGRMVIAIDRQTAVLSRAIGKVIPVELADTVAAKLAMLEEKISDAKSWPNNKNEVDEMLSDVRSLIQQVPPWAEDQILPKLNRIRWSASALSLLIDTKTLSKENIVDFLENADEMLKNQPNEAPKDLSERLLQAQKDTQKKLDTYRQELAITAAKRLLESGGTNAEFAAAQESLADWSDHPELKEQIDQMQQNLRSKQLESGLTELIGKFGQDLSKSQQEENPTVRLIALSEIFQEAAAVQQEYGYNQTVPEPLRKELHELIKRLEGAVNGAQESQNASQEKRAREYQKWVLTQIEEFHAAMDLAEKADKGMVRDTADYALIKETMAKHLLPVSEAYLDRAVARIYSEAFDRGWRQLDGKDEKHLQTELAKQEAVIEKRKP